MHVNNSFEFRYNGDTDVSKTTLRCVEVSTPAATLYDEVGANIFYNLCVCCAVKKTYGRHNVLVSKSKLIVKVHVKLMYALAIPFDKTSPPQLCSMMTQSEQSMYKLIQVLQNISFSLSY